MDAVIAYPVTNAEHTLDSGTPSSPTRAMYQAPSNKFPRPFDSTLGGAQLYQPPISWPKHEVAKVRFSLHTVLSLCRGELDLPELFICVTDTGPTACRISFSVDFATPRIPSCSQRTERTMMHRGRRCLPAEPLVAYKPASTRVDRQCARNGRPVNQSTRPTLEIMRRPG
jgi:hypothetical protein